MSRKALLIVDHDSKAIRRVRDGLLAITSQRIEGCTPADALVRLRIDEFDSVLLCGSLSADERSELWLQISQQAIPPRVVCIGGSDSTRPYSHYTVHQPIRLPSIPEPAALAKALALQPTAPDARASAAKPQLRLIGKSEAVLDIRRLIERFSETRNPVLITGEAGTGRCLVARQIHDASECRDAPLVSVDCAMLPPDTALETLIGRGRRGGDAAPGGQLAKAREGTLLLRNIGSLPLEVQDALTTILVSRPSASAAVIAPELRTRIIATTTRQLRECVRHKRFSERLYQLLEGFPINVPPLRERVEDVPLMVAHLTCAMRNRHGADIRFTSAAMGCMERYHWPGNQDEMLALLQSFAALTSGRVLDIDDLPADVRRCAAIRRLQDRHGSAPGSRVAPIGTNVVLNGAHARLRPMQRIDKAGSIRPYNLNREGNTAKIAG